MVGRIDLLLFHSDASISIVELKAENRPSEVAAGIGQLCMYAAAIPRALHEKQRPAVIRRILAAHVPVDQSIDLVCACTLAGVRFAYLPSFASFKQQMDSLPCEV